MDAGYLGVAAGHSGLVFDAARPGELVRQINFDHDISSFAINPATNRFVTGGSKDTWVRVWDFEPQKELDTLKGTSRPHLVHCILTGQQHLCYRKRGWYYQALEEL